jgi:hypothetical protein
MTGPTITEMSAQEDYYQMGLDPYLDIQALVSLPTMEKRIE